MPTRTLAYNVLLDGAYKEQLAWLTLDPNQSTGF